MHTLWLQPRLLPKYASETPMVKRAPDLLGPLDWKRFPERNLQRNWGQAAISYAAFAGAALVKLIVVEYWQEKIQNASIITRIQDLDS